MWELTLIEGYHVTTVIDPQEAEVAILPHSSIFGTIDDERLVPSSSELICIVVLDSQADGLATKPIRNVVRVTEMR